MENGAHSPRFPDVTIHLANFPPICAHAIFLSRSPYINSLLTAQPPSSPYTINLPISDANLTHDAIINTLQLLYSTSSLPPTIPNSATIVSNIASACLLGIYPVDLVESYRTILLDSNLTPQLILPFISFLLNNTPHPIHPLTAHPGPYPPFTTGLLSLVVNHFIHSLPIQLQSSSTALPPSANTEEYKALLVPLPFDILKVVLEHPGLAVHSERQRYELARTVIAKRAAREKQARRRTESGGGFPPPVEESVVLKVGGGEAGGVQIVRTFSRRRALWKAATTANGTVDAGRSRNSTAGSK